jgi:uncharacterized glyoxalase superfamily protein PhnB
MLALSPEASAMVPARMYVVVSGLDQYYADVIAAGAKVVYPLAVREYCMKDCRIVDPDGNELSFGESVG